MGRRRLEPSTAWWRLDLRAMEAATRRLHRDGLCADAQAGGQDRWFPGNRLDDPQTPEMKARSLQAAAKACDGCPLQADCALVAINNREDHGYWGGLPAWWLARIRRTGDVAALAKAQFAKLDRLNDQSGVLTALLDPHTVAQVEEDSSGVLATMLTDKSAA